MSMSPRLHGLACFLFFVPMCCIAIELMFGHVGARPINCPPDRPPTVGRIAAAFENDQLGLAIFLVYFQYTTSIGPGLDKLVRQGTTERIIIV